MGPGLRRDDGTSAATIAAARFAAIALLFGVLATGCTDTAGAGADSDKHPVFYGGVTGGGSRP